MSMQQRPLTQKQEAFVRKVAEGMAASRAYREAGYTATARAAPSARAWSHRVRARESFCDFGQQIGAK